jgi:hypothetical protein
MEQVLQAIQQFLASIDWTNLSIGALLAAFIGTLFIVFMSNTKAFAFGQKLGRKISKAGRKALKAQTWEKIENNLTGTIIAMFQGIQSGADEDDSA